jgi:hypothetical protein
MSINIPTFESVEEKIEWIKSQMLEMTQVSDDPALAADRLTLVSALNAALEEAGVDVAPVIEKPYIPEVITSAPIVESQ